MPSDDVDKKHIHASASNDADTSGLSGWTAIERNMMEHDIGMVQVYSDDIETLLVFLSIIPTYFGVNKLIYDRQQAGLFSAVLTAFVVATYPLLQAGDATVTNQLLAYAISTRSGGSPIPPAINSTISTLLSPSSTTLSARWINALFFVSLVLSLAAAFFGILAKQWLREYLQWKSPLASPRENVLIRELSYEAWEAWNIATTIFCIPAFLELAMVLFLGGLVIFLWTLDSTVAIVITVFVGLFLVSAVGFTVLPIFVQRCPYKSPTAWGLTVAWAAVVTLHRFIPTVYKALRWKELGSTFKTAVREYKWKQRPSSWSIRDRSVFSKPTIKAQINGEDRKRREIQQAVLLQLRSNLADLTQQDLETMSGLFATHGAPENRDPLVQPTPPNILPTALQPSQIIPQPIIANHTPAVGNNPPLVLPMNAHPLISGSATITCQHGVRRDNPLLKPASGLFSQISRRAHFVRVISHWSIWWICRSSHPTGIRDQIKGCVRSIHSEGAEPHAYELLATQCTLLSLMGGDLELDEPFSPLFSRITSGGAIGQPNSAPLGLPSDSPLTSLRRCLGVYRYPSRQITAYCMTFDAPSRTMTFLGNLDVNRPKEQNHAGSNPSGSRYFYSVTLVFGILATDVVRFVGLLRKRAKRTGSIRVSQFQLHTIYEAFILLATLATRLKVQDFEDRLMNDHYLDALRAIVEYHKTPVLRMLFDSRLPGIRSLAFTRACMHGAILLDPEEHNPIVSEEHMQFRHVEALLVHHLSITPSSSFDDVQIFAFIAEYWLRWPNGQPDPATMSTILSKMADAVEGVPRRNAQLPPHTTSFIFVLDVGWPIAVDVWRATRRNLAQQYCRELVRLLHAFEMAYSSHLITPARRAHLDGLYDHSQYARGIDFHRVMNVHLHNSLKASHEGMTSCDLVSCRWLSHSCGNELDTCPLLPLPMFHDFRGPGGRQPRDEQPTAAGNNVPEGTPERPHYPQPQHQPISTMPHQQPPQAASTRPPPVPGAFPSFESTQDRASSMPHPWRALKRFLTQDPSIVASSTRIYGSPQQSIELDSLVPTDMAPPRRPTVLTFPRTESPEPLEDLHIPDDPTALGDGGGQEALEHAEQDTTDPSGSVLVTLAERRGGELDALTSNTDSAALYNALRGRLQADPAAEFALGQSDGLSADPQPAFSGEPSRRRGHVSPRSTAAPASLRKRSVPASEDDRKAFPPDDLGGDVLSAAVSSLPTLAPHHLSTIAENDTNSTQQYAAEPGPTLRAPPAQKDATHAEIVHGPKGGGPPVEESEDGADPPDWDM